MEDRMGAISSGIFRRQQNDVLCSYRTCYDQIQELTFL